MSGPPKIFFSLQFKNSLPPSVSPQRASVPLPKNFGSPLLNVHLFMYIFLTLGSQNILQWSLKSWKYHQSAPETCFYSICLVVLHQSITLLLFLLLYFIACILLSSCAKLNYTESNSNRLCLVFWLCVCCYLWEYISRSLYSGVMLFEIYNLQRWIIQFNWNLNYK